MIALRLLARGLTRPALTLLGASTILLVGCRTTPVVPTSAVLVQPTVANQPMASTQPATLAPLATGAPTASAAAVGGFNLANLTITQSDWINDPYAPRKSAMGRKWREGEALLQGYLGVNSIQDLTIKGGDGEDVEGSVSQYPVIGGGAQWKVGGERVDFGFEALMSIGGRGNVGAFAVGGGGAAIVVDLDLLIVDFFGGPFLSLPLGDKTRIYGSIGPLVQFAQTHQSSIDPRYNGSTSGFGIGVYARTGFEFQIGSGSLIGLGFRWFDSNVDLSTSVGDLEMQSVEAMLTVSVMG